MKKTDKTYYQILGLEHTASPEDIKRAYRSVAKEQHPDVGHHAKSPEQRRQDNEDMLLINEAYQTLIDKVKRTEYDLIIGVTVSIKIFEFTKTGEDEARELFLARVFYPARSSINRMLSRYGKELKALSQDLYDEELLDNFQAYVDELEKVLRKASNMFSTHPAPVTLTAPVHMMRQSIAQAADALEEMHRFCLNFDYDHLSMAENLIRISFDLSKQAYAMTKHP